MDAADLEGDLVNILFTEEDIQRRLAEMARQIEQDYEGRVYLAVTVDDDPGRDFGRDRQPGHRFFFGVEEVEILPPP